MITRLLSREAKLAVIGLGYVGLPIALEFASKLSVIGFDINDRRIKMMQNNNDPSRELPSENFLDKDIVFTANPTDLKSANFFIIAVPTPIDQHKDPNLFPLLSACRTVGKVLTKGDYVVFESTVYPGCTQEDCVPVLEEVSGLVYNTDFKVGFSPERINPGDKVHTLSKIIKITSGSDHESSEQIAAVYELIVEAGVHKASSIKVAEAAKIIENTQRDVNIAFMNELSMVFNKLGINTFEVLEAAATKWNFLPFSPGLVGGHCIGVDPYYLIHKTKELDYHARVINSGRAVNDYMGIHIAKELVKLIISKDKNIRHSKVLVMGVTFKENVSDIRNSKVVDLIEELKSFKVGVDVVDSRADADAVAQEYGFRLTEKITSDYDAIVMAVPHDEYKNMTESYFESISSDNGIFVDIKGDYRKKIKQMTYWSL